MTKTQILESGKSVLQRFPNRRVRPITKRNIPETKPDEFVNSSSVKTADSIMFQMIDKLSQNIVKPKIIKSILIDFNAKKKNLIQNLDDVLDKETLLAIKSSKTAEEVANIIERNQVNLLLKLGKSKDSRVDFSLPI